jgi:two-component system, LytTR family, sensor kinase
MRVRRLVTDPQTSPKPSAANELGDAIALRYPGFGKIFLIWTAIGVLTSLRYQWQRPYNTEVGEAAFIAAFTALYYPWVALTPLVFRLEKRFPLGQGNWFRNLGLLAILSVPICLLASPLMSGVFIGVLSVMQPGITLPVRRLWLGHFPMAEVLFWCSVTGGYFVRSQFQLRVQEQRTSRLALEKSQLEAGLKQAQLDVLRARLNPHFLFNSLQNISVMTRQDPQTASRMLARLGDLLRAVLRQDSEPECTLYEEIELTRAYAALEQMRFGDRLDVRFTIATEVQQAMVPCFLLQPLIENAIIHGLRGAGKTGIIAVSAARDGRDLLMTITDNGIGAPEEALTGRKMGVGLGSTLERLATMYPERQTFSMRRPVEGGTEVRIAIPLRFGDDKRLSSHHEQPSIAGR